MFSHLPTIAMKKGIVMESSLYNSSGVVYCRAAEVPKTLDLEYYSECVIAYKDLFHPFKFLENTDFVEGQAPVKEDKRKGCSTISNVHNVLMSSLVNVPRESRYSYANSVSSFPPPYL